MTESPHSNTYSPYPDSVNIPPTIGKFPPNNELEEMVNSWKAQFDTCENKEDLDALISLVSKIILIEGNKLSKKELKDDFPTKRNATQTHAKSNRTNKSQSQKRGSSRKLKKKKNDTKEAEIIQALFRRYPIRAARTILGARNQNYIGESEKLGDFASISTEVSHTVKPCSNIPWKMTDEDQEIYLKSPPTRKDRNQSLEKSPVHIK